MADTYDPFAYSDQFSPRKPRAASQPDPSQLDPVTAEIRRQRNLETMTDIALSPPADQVARATKLARRAGVPPVMIEDQLDDAERSLNARNLTQVMDGYSVIGRHFVANPRSAVMAQDDSENLGILGSVWDTIKKLPATGKAAWNRVGVLGTQINYNIADWLGEAGDFLDTIGHANALTQGEMEQRKADRKSYWGGGVNYAQQRLERSRPKYTGFIQQNVLQGLENVPNSLIAMGAGYVSGSPNVAVALMGAQTAMPAYTDARMAGKDIPTSLRYGAEQGAIEALTEKIPASSLLTAITKRTPFGKAFMEQLVTEIPGEQVATVLQDFSEWATLHPDKPFSAFLAERPEAALSTLLQTISGTTAQTGAVHVTTRALDAAGQYAERRGQAARAQAEGRIIAQTGEAAQQSTLRQRDPVAFNSLLKDIAEEHGAEHVHVPGEAVQAYMQSDAFDPRSDPLVEYADHIDEAVASGGDVVLPTEFALGTLPGTPAWDALKEDMRLSPGGMSSREAQTFEEAMEDVVADLTKRMDEQEADTAAERSAREKLADSIALKLGDSYTAPAARVMADLSAQYFQNRARRLGVELTGDEFAGIDVRQVLPEALAAARNADATDLVINALRAGKETSFNSGPSLIQWIAKRGGLNDSGGDFAAMGLDKWHRGKVGQRKAIRKFDAQAALGGISGAGDYGADSTLRAAIEEGYFPELQNVENEAGPSSLDASVLHDAVRDELAGNPRYSSAPRVDHMRAAADELGQMLSDAGHDPASMTDAAIREFIDRQATESVGGGLEQSPADTARWGRSVDAIVRGDKPGSPIIRLGETPPVLQRLGMPAGELAMSAAKMARARREHPEVPLATWKALPDLIEDPRAVFPSQRDDGSLIVAVDARDASNNPIIVPIIATPHSGSVVLSVYGKQDGDQFIAKEIARAQNEGAQLYVKEGLADALINPEGLSGNAAPHAPIASGVSAKPARPILSRRDFVKKSLEQEARGRIVFGTGRVLIELHANSDLSTYFHEFMGHFALENLRADAQLEDAPDDIKADWQTVQDWFAASGHKMQGDEIPVEAHELWARGMERYLMEGKAPSSALARVFETIRSWMVSIYRTIDALRSPISPEVRQVMDRMLASDDEIVAARERQSLNALFKDAAEAGMSASEFSAYRDQLADAKSAAYSALVDKTLRTFRARETKRYRDARKEVRASVAADLDATPIFRALRNLQVTPMDAEWVRDEMGADAIDMLPRRVPPIARDGGADPVAVAEMSGFATGREMLESLIGAEQEQRQAKEGGDKRGLRERRIETATDTEMERRYGDPLNDGSIEREALEAVHNNMQGEIIASEIRVLARQTGDTPTPYAIAREWARGRIRSSQVRDHLSGAALQRYARAAAKAGRAAEQAMLKHDVDETFRQKQFQMLNNALIAEAKIAGDEVDAAVRRMGRIAKAQTMKSIDQDYLDQAHALLEEVELRNRSQKSIDRQGRWAEWATAREAEGFDLVVPASFEASLGKTHYTRLPVETLLGLNEAVKQVMHLGRLKQTLLDRQEEREWDAVFDEAISSAGALQQKPPRDLLEPGLLDAMKGKVLGWESALLKMETVFDWLDGGNSNGVFNRVAFRPIAEAQAREQDMLTDYFGRIKALFEALPEKVIRRWGDTVTLPFINRETGLPERLSRKQLVVAALNVGNEGNLQRLTDGYGWNAGALMDALDQHLTAEEWKFVQDVWDTIGTLWPQIEAMEKRVNGVAPEKVEPLAFDTRHGAMRGGYFPAIYDATRDLKIEEYRGKESDLFETVYTRASTRSSATKNRMEEVKRPISLEIGNINRHLGEVIHDVTHREAVIQAHRLLTNSRVATAVDQALGQEIRQQFRPWVKFVANSWAMERAGNEGFGKFMGKLRANATAVGMGMRLSTMLTQFAGYSNSIEVVGETWMAKAIAQSAAHPIETFKFVMERSDEVRNRMDTLDRDIRTQLTILAADNPASRALARVNDTKRFLFHGIGYADRVVVVPTWMGAYNKALAAGMSEQDAAYAGDKAVRASQGAGGAKDLAAIQRGTGKSGELLKAMTMFYSYFSAMYQRERTLARDVLGRDTRRPRNVPRLMARAWWLLVVPPILTELIKMSLGGGGPDDDEWWAQWTARKLIANAIGPIPLARDVFEPTWSAAVGGKFFNPSFTPMQRILDAIVNSGQDAGKIARGEETKKATKHTLETAGYVTGLVPGQAASAAQFLVDVGNGDADPQSFSDWVEGLSSGKIED